MSNNTGSESLLTVLKLSNNTGSESLFTVLKLSNNTGSESLFTVLKCAVDIPKLTFLTFHFHRAYSAIYQKLFWKFTLFVDIILLQMCLFIHKPILV